MKALALTLVVAVGCEGNKREAAPAPPPPPRAPVADPTRLDWKNLDVSLGVLGRVRVREGRAVFRLEGEEDEDADLVARQDGATDSALELEAPTYADLDGDGFDESLIPYALSLHDPEPTVFGVYVFTLRDGKPLQLATLQTDAPRGFTVAGRTVTTDLGQTWKVGEGL